MTLTRPGPLAPEEVARPTAVPPCAGVPPLGEGPLSADVVLRSRWLDVLLGDPAGSDGPRGRTVTAAAQRDPLPSGALGAVLPGPGDVRRVGADGIVRVLRPLFRRDLGVGFAWAVRPLSGVLGAAGGAEPAGGHGDLAALLGPAALIAAAGGVLHTTARLVDGLIAHEPGVRQWQPVLAAVFADLLACESLTAVALRAPALTEGGTPALTAAAGYVVPHLVGQALDDLELVLNGSGFGPGTTERRTLAKLAADRAAAGVDAAATAARQARLIQALPTLADQAAGASRTLDARGEGGEHPQLRRLFRLGATVAAGTEAPGADAMPAAAVAAVLPEAAARLAGRPDDDPAVAALARVARRLATEQRRLRLPYPTAGHSDPADPVTRGLSDRQALLLLAAAVLGVGQEADGFLGGPHWALLALVRVTGRLGAPLPATDVDPAGDVWAELAERTRQGVDCDVYGTELLWAGAGRRRAGGGT
ncbi:hypothetical protein ACFW34_21970 [Streptomyces sp. NPDC058848]|uniref:hypothetical protein n=1 Tax=unclassified Streptomyces TaxID=2593676 RepID=UPI0036A79C63